MVNPVALDVRVPNTLETLGNVMNIGNSMLAFKRAAATLPYAVPTAQAGMQQAQAVAQHATLNVGEARQNYMRQLVAGAINSPGVVAGDPKEIEAHLSHIAQEGVSAGIPEPLVAQQIAPLQQLAATNPKAVREALIGKLTASFGGAAQAQAIAPSGPVLHNGQELIPTNTNPLAGPTGAIPGMTTQLAPPPTTPVIGPGGTPQMLGVQPVPGPQPTGTPQAHPGGFALPTGYAPGVVPNATDLAHTVQADYANVVHTANAAARLQGVMETIRSKVAEGAYTGVGAEQRAWAAGFGQFLGMNPSALTDSQEISKQVALATGLNPQSSSDMGREIARLANPHNGMTAQAINHVSNEIISQLQMDQKAQAFLRPQLANPQGYMQARQQFNEVSNPRILQFAQGSPGERAAIVKGMTPQQKAAFIAQLESAEKMGILQ